MRKTLLMFLVPVLIACQPLLESPSVTPTTLSPSATPTSAAPSSTPARGGEASPSPAPPLSSRRLTVAFLQRDVALLQRESLWIWREGEAPQLLTTGALPPVRLSDDGQIIAFLREDGLYVIRADGAGERLLVSRSYMESFRPANASEVYISHLDFVPGTHEIWFSLSSVDVETGYASPLNDLHRAHADGGTPEALLEPGRGGGEWTVSPDGRFFALSQAEQIRVLSRDGSRDQVLLRFKRVATDSERFYFPQVVWRPDSGGVYTVIPPSNPFEPTEPARYYFLPLEGDPVLLAEFESDFPLISPDGSRVAYLPRGEDDRSVHVFELGGEDVQIYRAESAQRPALRLHQWNPDARRIFFFDMNNPMPGWLGGPGMPLRALSIERPLTLQWVDPDRFIFQKIFVLMLYDLRTDTSRMIGDLGEENLESPGSYYDFALTP